MSRPHGRTVPGCEPRRSTVVRQRVPARGWLPIAAGAVVLPRPVTAIRSTVQVPHTGSMIPHRRQTTRPPRACIRFT